MCPFTQNRENLLKEILAAKSQDKKKKKIKLGCEMCCGGGPNKTDEGNRVPGRTRVGGAGIYSSIGGNDGSGESVYRVQEGEEESRAAKKKKGTGGTEKGERSTMIRDGVSL